MTAISDFALAPIFQAVGNALRDNQTALNLADEQNGNHGDHMVQIFYLATQAAECKKEADLADAMDEAAGLLEDQEQNGTAQIYAVGLRKMAVQFRKYDVSLDDLILYVRGALAKESANRKEGQADSGSGKVLKALASGLAAWGRAGDVSDAGGQSLDMGSLFEFGMAYLQAKSRGGSRTEIIADAAVSVSPLRDIPYRYQSGKIAVQALLEAMQSESGLLPS